MYIFYEIATNSSKFQERKVVFSRKAVERKTENASAGNRTRVTSMATRYSTTRPQTHGHFQNIDSLYVSPVSPLKRYPQRTVHGITIGKSASAGNRTRVTSMATRYSTTRPQTLACLRREFTVSAQVWVVINHFLSSYPRIIFAFRLRAKSFLYFLLYLSSSV